ncbi:hypothetical protein [Nocardia blacklockiae]|uniref:hypothetical protein n=1 Tax=Nocardia blacklockiae TaxID=480036 RepID=UPI0018936EC5|nr:hypothetical protein [Nocardia blacklockiae]MBF6176124.1 hypothetical protein [Nocardia blacklockiae]
MQTGALEDSLALDSDDQDALADEPVDAVDALAGDRDSMRGYFRLHVDVRLV